MAERNREPNQLLVPTGEIDHHVCDMTATFAADVTLARLQAHLARHEQWLPIDGDPTVPIGQLILHNSTGPLRLGYGAWRDLLLGAQFTNGRGELITVGGRVLKNVAGYDVTKLLVGSYGVFGSPVCFTARTWKRPAGAVHAVLKVEVAEKMTSILASPLKPHWVALTPDALHFGYHGDDSGIAYVERNLAALAPARVRRVSIDDDVEVRRSLWSIDLAMRVIVPPANLPAFVRDAHLVQFVADAVFGVIAVPRDSAIDVRLCRETVQRLRGTLWEFDGGGMPRGLKLEPATYAILRQLKTALDPDATLAPLPNNIA